MSERQRYYAAKEMLDTLYELAVGRFLEESEFDVRDHLTDSELPMWEEAQRIELEHFTHRRQTAAKVVIEVLGGVAEVTSKPDGVEVEIVDHDNEEKEAHEP
jgi:hypothetical protein